MPPTGPQIAHQPRLFAFEMGERAAETLVISASNRPAWDVLARWRTWPGGAAVLSGPPRSGRTHMAQAWAQAVDAAPLAQRDHAALAQAFAAAQRRLFIDDADHAIPEEALIRLLDLARHERGAVLFIARTPPAEWPVSIPDLRSRLLAVPSAVLAEPDEDLLQVLLTRLCRERFMKLSPSAAMYLAARIERSFAAASAVVEALDAGLMHGARPITVAAARKVLGEDVQDEDVQDQEA